MQRHRSPHKEISNMKMTRLPCSDGTPVRYLLSDLHRPVCMGSKVDETSGFCPIALIAACHERRLWPLLRMTMVTGVGLTEVSTSCFLEED